MRHDISCSPSLTLQKGGLGRAVSLLLAHSSIVLIYLYPKNNIIFRLVHWGWHRRSPAPDAILCSTLQILQGVHGNGERNVLPNVWPSQFLWLRRNQGNQVLKKAELSQNLSCLYCSQVGNLLLFCMGGFWRQNGKWWERVERKGGMVGWNTATSSARRIFPVRQSLCGTGTWNCQQLSTFGLLFLVLLIPAIPGESQGVK